MDCLEKCSLSVTYSDSTDLRQRFYEMQNKVLERLALKRLNLRESNSSKQSSRIEAIRDAIDQNDLANAEILLGSLINLEKAHMNDPEIIDLYTTLLLKQGRTKKAKDFIENISKQPHILSPSDLDYYNALVFMKIGSINSALTFIQKGINVALRDYDFKTFTKLNEMKLQLQDQFTERKKCSYESMKDAIETQ